MGMQFVKDCSTGTTANITTEMDEILNYSADLEKRSSFALGKEMHCGSGGSSKTLADSKESTVPCSETKADTDQASLCDRLTQSLISAGLVCGTTPTSMRDASGQLTLDSVLKPQGGVCVGKRKAG